MKIAVAGDSVGVALAELIFAHLKTCAGIEVEHVSQNQDGETGYYANIADRVASAILAQKFDRGILCCGTGIGMVMAANKVPGIRAALTHDTYSAERAAKSNNSHIITLGARVVGVELAKRIVDTWLASEFDPKGASASNGQAVDALDRKYRQ